MAKKKKEEKEKKLTPTELLKIDLNAEKTIRLKAEMITMEKEQEIITLKQNIYRLTADNMAIELKDIHIKKENNKNRLKKQKESNKEYNENLREKYNLPEKWGFDPDTGLLS